jgi:hypothetical protein
MIHHLKIKIMKSNVLKLFTWLLSCTTLLLSACQKETAELETLSTSANNPSAPSTQPLTEAVLVVIDEESIDNGNLPNNFSDVDVNDQLATVGLRQTLRYFGDHVGDTITLYTGEVGKEGWHALKTIPTAWKNAGPTTNGARNFVQAGPGLGGGNDPEALLDKISNVTPLRAKGLAMLTGKTVLAVVYDGDVSTNYGPLDASLKGANLGMVALEVLQVKKRTNGSSGSLPSVQVRVINVNAASAATLKLFGNAPVPSSSSVPFDVTPPVVAPAIVLATAQ